jgi:competence protein ComEC
MASLRRDLPGSTLDVLWLTHGHSDHTGGAVEILRSFKVGAVVMGDRNSQAKSSSPLVVEAASQGVPVVILSPENSTNSPALPPEVAPVVPRSWPPSCGRDENQCSLGLRVKVGKSTALFIGDAGAEEERQLEGDLHSTLLQVGHHGSTTSTSESFLAKVTPRYAVISVGGRDNPMTRRYCHPRASTVSRLAEVLEQMGAASVLSFRSDSSCTVTDADWVQTPAPSTLWVTARDGDVSLASCGDGQFSRQTNEALGGGK